jgi:hypothetical protein
VNDVVARDRLQLQFDNCGGGVTTSFQPDLESSCTSPFLAFYLAIFLSSSSHITSMTKRPYYVKLQAYIVFHVATIYKR